MLFVRNRWFVCFGYTVGLAGGHPAVRGRGSFVKLVQRLARLGELLLALAGPAAALGAPRKWS